MKYLLPAILILLCLSGCRKSPDVDWNTEHRINLAVRVHRLEDAVKQIQVERDALWKNKESETFVSVAALRATGYKLATLAKPREGKALEEWAPIVVLDQIRLEQFSKWIAKAREWDANETAKQALDAAIDLHPTSKRECSPYDEVKR